jgi:hypothetical protein
VAPEENQNIGVGVAAGRNPRAATPQDQGVDTGRELELVAFNGVENETAEFTVAVGPEPGTYSWSATYRDAREGQPSHSKVTSVLGFDYRPHLVSLAAWNIASFVDAGETISVCVGAKCNKGCSLAGSVLNILDAFGETVSEVVLCDTPLQGTAALYWATATFTVPNQPGIYTYRVQSVANGEHAAAQSSLSVVVAAQPDCQLEVSIIDERSQASIPGAMVYLHPRIVSADANGLARVPAVSGQARIDVRAEGYYPSQNTLIITGDAALTLKITPKPQYEGDF